MADQLGRLAMRVEGDWWVVALTFTVKKRNIDA